MDPRIRWADILMRIEVPNRTTDSDRKLQNSTNNLINRHDHPRYFMLAWHSTGAHGMRSNRVMTMVLHEVAVAYPPLPPNSTRGLTPGLINPQLGNVVGNVVPQPAQRDGQSRLRVPFLPQAQANLPQPNQIQTAQVHNNQGRDNGGRSNGAGQNRNRTGPGPKGRPSKRQPQDFIDDTTDDNMDTGSDETTSSEVRIDTPDVPRFLLT